MPQKSLWEEPVTREEILERIFLNFEAGTRSRKHPFHTGVFATSGEEGPEARYVVLRRFWREEPRIAFHAHAASPKVFQVESDPNVSWVFYDPTNGLQVRIKGVASIHRSDELEDEQWSKTSNLGKRCYLGEPAGLENDEPTTGLPFTPMDLEVDVDVEEGRGNFVVISTLIESIDCLELDVRGHRRSRFTWGRGKPVKSVWLTP